MVETTNDVLSAKPREHLYFGGISANNIFIISEVSPDLLCFLKGIGTRLAQKGDNVIRFSLNINVLDI